MRLLRKNPADKQQFSRHSLEQQNNNFTPSYAIILWGINWPLACDVSRLWVIICVVREIQTYRSRFFKHLCFDFIIESICFEFQCTICGNAELLSSNFYLPNKNVRTSKNNLRIIYLITLTIICVLFFIWGMRGNSALRFHPVPSGPW